MKELKTLNMEDNQVKNMNINFLRIFGNFLIIIPKILIYLIFVNLEIFKPYYRVELAL
jgi:hypothetical protein